MAIKKSLVVRSFALSTRGVVLGRPISSSFPKAGAFLQQKRSLRESAAIGNIPYSQRLHPLRLTPWNFEQKRYTSNSEKADPNIEKEESPDESANSETNAPKNENNDDLLWRDSEFNEKEEEDPYFWLKYASMGGPIDPKLAEAEKKEWLPFWNTPERDPNKSIYVQHPIAEKDCRPLRLYIPTEECMEEIGTFVAMMMMTTPDLDTFEVLPNKGDVIFLQGDLGAGKSVFARGFVRGALGNWDLDVPSPTYILSNTYFASEEQGSNQNVEIYHMDLYRLPDHSNQQRFMLNLDHVFKNCISLIEWPERLPADLVPEERLEISLDFATRVKHDGSVDMKTDQQYRIMTFNPIGYLWRRRVYDMRYMGYIEDLVMKEKDEFNANEPQK